jgi:hypothetical protein
MRLTRRTALGLAFAGWGRGEGRAAPPDDAVQLAGPTVAVLPSVPAERMVGIAYSMWHQNGNWSNTWGTPLLGHYASDDPAAIEAHARWIAGAGIDFIYFGWSNTLNENASNRFIERSTEILYSLYTNFGVCPRVCIMIGNPGDPNAMIDGRLSAKADQVFSLINSTERHRSLYQHYLGRPLLIVYVGTPAPHQDGLPKWSDPRFTVRFMTGFLTEQPRLLGPGLVSKYGYWSWEDRGAPTYAVHDGVPENMTVVAAWRPSPTIPAQGRNGGKTYVANWERARRVGPRIVLAGTFNEWGHEEQPSADISKDIEPSHEFGFAYLDVVRQQATLFRQGR